MRFAIFVDGPNLIGSFNKLNVDVGNYQDFYSYILSSTVDVWRTSFIGGGDPVPQLWRVFWYQVGYMDELRLDDPNVKANLRTSFEENKDLSRGYLAVAGRDSPDQKTEVIRELAWANCFDEARHWYKSKKAQLEKMRRFNFSVRSSTNFVEIIENGHWKINFLKRQVEEKGIDTALAVDLVTLNECYDVAILISGDADMIPSVNYAKQRGKHVAVVDLINGAPPEQKGWQLSTRLKSTVDFVVPIYEADMVRKGIAKTRGSKT
ncbi:NYN domain-containing protein [Chitinimonas sp. PSY-7]|uniref:NYN domain-containing protein n=1 Tax=Chitinimonas sp. PSY-7 TaxID=3459088 RepID=UPI00403FCB06